MTNKPIKIEFDILLPPKALKRHRTAIRNKKMINYDPSSSDKKLVRLLSAKYMPDTLIETPIHIEFIFYMPRPKSHFRTGKYKYEIKKNAPTLHSKKPDLSNLIKLYEDAFSGLFYKDDCQIVTIKAEKKYTDIKPFVHVFICESE